MSDIQEVKLGTDVSFLVGEGTSRIRIRVSKAHVCLISPYFQALLGPRFAEGSTAASGQDFVLKDDDPHEFLGLMKLLHLCIDIILPLPSEGLLALAVVADKYGCLGPLQLMWASLTPPAPAASTIAELVNLTTVSYIMDKHELFEMYTKRLLLDYSIADMDVNRDLFTKNEWVPQIAWLNLEARRSRILPEFIQAFGQLLCKPCMGVACTMAADYHSKMVEQVRPIMLENWKDDTINKKLQRLEDIKIPDIDRSLNSCGLYRAWPDHDLPPSLRLIESLCQGLCLDCVKADRSTCVPECRIPH